VLNLAERLREFIAGNRFDDFKSAQDFSEKLIGKLEESWSENWSTDKVVNSIKRITRSTYEFFRLTDTTPFGGKSPIKLKFGGPDKTSIAFVGKLDHWYFSRFGGNTDKDLRSFLEKEYLAKGAALFGRESSESIDDFRNAAGDKFKNLTDRQVKTIITGSVQRIRNWGHIGSMDQAEIEFATIIATLDSRTTELCQGLDGKIIRVGVAQKTIERLNQLQPGDFAAEMYESKIGKAISKDPVGTISKWLEDDGKTIGDQIVETGRGFPPYHPNCRTRLEGVIAGVE
jgi:hypothetical protein